LRVDAVPVEGRRKNLTEGNKSAPVPSRHCGVAKTIAQLEKTVEPRMLVVAALIMVICVVGGFLLLSQSFQSLARPFDWVSRRFPGVMSFLSGALMGAFPGFIPAVIIQATTGSYWIAGGAWGACVLLCGAAWFRFTNR
jgi:hypothetical protein